jgi:hypothetical protein
VQRDGIQSLSKPHQLPAQAGQPLAEIAGSGVLEGPASRLERRDHLGAHLGAESALLSPADIDEPLR